MKTQVSFEKLAELFEGSGASGAERAYKRAVENLMLELVRLNQLHCVRLKQTSTILDQRLEGVLSTYSEEDRIKYDPECVYSIYINALTGELVPAE